MPSLREEWGTIGDGFQKRKSSFLLNNHEHPSRSLSVIGITGAIGKTTVAHLIDEVLKSAGYSPFVLGTLSSVSDHLGTPEQLAILRFMRDHLNRGGTHFIMEVTSGAIDNGCISGIDFDIKLLTQARPQHLDCQPALRAHQEVMMNFMLEGNAHKILPSYFAEEIIDFETKLLGDVNRSNLKAAMSVLRHLNISETIISTTLSASTLPSGRLESVDEGQAFLVLIDYAHDPDSLEETLKAVKQLASDRKGKLRVLFGYGGTPGPEKQVLMGRIASEVADFLVITADDPRSEQSQAVLDDAVAGLNQQIQGCSVVPDRKLAIEHIIRAAGDADVVFLVASGHQADHDPDPNAVQFDDREEAARAIWLRLSPTPPSGDDNQQAGVR